MDNELKLITKTLFTWSKLEKNRAVPPQSDLRDVSAFKSIDPIVQHSLKVPTLMRTHTPAGNPLKTAQPTQRPFEDESIIKKLLQAKDRIPLSSRILRPGSSSSS